jgi:hypothetical protein
MERLLLWYITECIMFLNINGVGALTMDLEPKHLIAKDSTRLRSKKLDQSKLRETQMKISMKIMMKKISARTLKLRVSLPRIRTGMILLLKLMMNSYSNLRLWIIHPIY